MILAYFSRRLLPAWFGFGSLLVLATVACAQEFPAGRYDFSSLIAQKGTLWSVLFAFAGGVLVSLTPCVYPMIPITVGIITAQAAPGGFRRSFALSFTYVFGLVVVYSVLGLLVGLLGAQVRGVLMSPPFLAAVAAIFVLLALSMLGLYELRIPTALATRLGSLGGGGFVGVLLMGMVSGLVVSPCTAAPLAGILTFVATQGSPAIGWLLLFAFAWGMGILLLVVGTFAGAVSRLPKSGAWMLDVKRLLGLVFLAVAVYFVRTLMPPMIYHIALGLCLVGGGVALGALDSLVQPTTGQRIKRGIALLIMVLGFYLLLGTLWTQRVWLPERTGLSVASEGIERESAALGNTVSPLEWETDVYSAFEKARDEERYVLMEWSAQWCDQCKKMEREAFSRPDIRKELARYILLRIDVTELDAREEKLAQKHKFFAPPTLIIADGEGNQVGKLEGYESPEVVLSFLENPEASAASEAPPGGT